MCAIYVSYAARSVPDRLVSVRVSLLISFIRFGILVEILSQCIFVGITAIYAV